jgi:hypothetical protein
MVTKRELQEDDVRRAKLAEEAARREEEWRKGKATGTSSAPTAC